MPRLSRGERQKLALFLGLLFVVANLFLLAILRRHYQDATVRVRQLRADLSYANAWLGEKDLWTKRLDWLAAKQPKLQDPGQANVVLLEALQKSAGECGLTIQEQTLKEPRATPEYREASVQLRVGGTLEQLCRWLAAVQQPESFQAVTNFSLKSEGNDTNKVRCDLTVARWYAPH